VKNLLRKAYLACFRNCNNRFRALIEVISMENHFCIFLAFAVVLQPIPAIRPSTRCRDGLQQGVPSRQESAIVDSCTMSNPKIKVRLSILNRWLVSPVCYGPFLFQLVNPFGEINSPRTNGLELGQPGYSSPFSLDRCSIDFTVRNHLSRYLLIADVSCWFGKKEIVRWGNTK
jgi:hypothetical protein